jgi:ferredoxin
MSVREVQIPNEKCDFCGTCVAVCPADAIELEEKVIRVLDDRCTRCCACVHVCPLGVPREVP